MSEQDRVLSIFHRSIHLDLCLLFLRDGVEELTRDVRTCRDTHRLEMRRGDSHPALVVGPPSQEVDASPCVMILSARSLNEFTMFSPDFTRTKNSGIDSDSAMDRRAWV